MNQYIKVCKSLSKIKCPICQSKLLKPKDPRLEAVHFMTDDEETIYNIETWCAKDSQHYRIVFESIEDGPYEMIGEDLLLFDDECEYTIERWLCSKKINIIIKDMYGSDDEKIIEMEDPQIPLKRLTIEKLYTLLTF